MGACTVCFENELILDGVTRSRLDLPDHQVPRSIRAPPSGELRERSAISCSRADSATSAWLGLTGQVRVGRRRRLGRWTRACQVAARLQSKGALVAAPA